MEGSENEAREKAIEEFMQQSNLEKLINEEFNLGKLKEQFEKVTMLKGLDGQQLFNAILDTPTFFGRYILKLNQVNNRLTELKRELSDKESSITDNYYTSVAKHKVPDKNELTRLLNGNKSRSDIISKIGKMEALQETIELFIYYFKSNRSYDIKNALEVMRLRGETYFD